MSATMQKYTRIGIISWLLLMLLVVSYDVWVPTEYDSVIIVGKVDPVGTRSSIIYTLILRKENNTITDTTVSAAAYHQVNVGDSYKLRKRYFPKSVILCIIGFVLILAGIIFEVTDITRKQKWS